MNPPMRVIDRRQNPGQPTQLSAFDERVGRQTSVRNMIQADEKIYMFALCGETPISTKRYSPVRCHLSDREPRIALYLRRL